MNDLCRFPQKSIVRFTVLRPEKLQIKVDIPEVQPLRFRDDVLKQPVLNLLIIQNNAPELRAELGILQIRHDHHQRHLMLRGNGGEAVQGRRDQRSVPFDPEAERCEIRQLRSSLTRSILQRLGDTLPLGSTYAFTSACRLGPGGMYRRSPTCSG